MPVPPPQFKTKPGSKFRGYRTLTQPQFQAWAAKAPKKPGGRSYEGYRSYLEREREGRIIGGKKPAARGGGGRSSSSSLLELLRIQTPKQVEKQANRMAQAQLDAQRKFLLAQTAQEKADALRQMQAVSAAGRMAAAQNAGLFGQVGGEYNAAAQEIAGLGTNLAGAIGASTMGNVAAQNAGLAAIGAPEMAVGGPAGTESIAGPTQAGVEGYRGGTLPAQALGTAGEAAQFGLAGMVAAQNLRATQEGTATYVEAMRDLNKNQRLELLKLASTRPELVAGFLDKLNERNMTAYKLRREVETSIQEANSAQQALEFKYAELKADAVTSAQKLALDKWYKGQKVAIDNYRASVYAQNAATSAYNAQTSRIRAGKSKDYGKEQDVSGRTWMATVANQTALLPTRLKGTDAAFNWVWSRIVNKIPKKQRAAARKWLKKNLAQVAASSGSSATPGGSLVLPP